MRRTWLFLLESLILAAVCHPAWAAVPTILSVDVDRTTRSLAPGVVRFGEKVTVKVSDADTVDNLGCVTIVNSADPTAGVTLSYCRGEGSMVNMTTVSFVWTRPDSVAPFPPASYQVVATDGDGNTDSFTTGTPPALPLFRLTLTAPAMDSVLTTTLRPTFQWQNSAAVTKIEVCEEGTQSLVWTKSLTAGTVSVLYANGGTVFGGRTQLLTGHSYLWLLNTGTGTAVYSEPGDPVTHKHAVNVKDWQEARGRFAVAGDWGTVPLPPDLPGKLVYATRTVTSLATTRFTSGLLGYTPDPHARLWLGPELSDYPDWSPQGDKLLYGTPVGLFADGLGGLPATLVPGTSGLDAEGRWTPDGRLVYRRATADGADSGLWIARDDGSDAHPVATPPRATGPAPSPNGIWIAYQSPSDTGAPSLRMVHYDGSGDHAVLATGVRGQDPGYAVIALGQPAWSPDGAALAVIFQARASGRPDLLGIGTLPSDGGPITPVFLSDLWSCCGYPQAPAWSPDGSSIVFSSAHQQPDLTDEAIANAVELWLVAADGSSTIPVQLTNDFSMTRHVSWWGPNTPAGDGVTVSREGVTITFAGVSAEGVTQVLLERPLSAPLPEGMQLLAGPYDVITTALYTGPLAIAVDAARAGLPADGSLDQLALLHWENGAWVAVTVPPGAAGTVEGQCDSLGQFVVARQLLPHSDFIAAPQEGLVPLEVHFADTSTGTPTAWSWDFGDGSLGNDQNPSHTYEVGGEYTVSLTTTNAGGSHTCTKSAYVSVLLPTPVADFTADPTTGVPPLSVTFTDLSQNAPTSWSWDFGDGATSTVQNPSHTYEAIGIYAVTLTASNASGSNTCAGYVSALQPAPVADFTADLTTGVPPLRVTFTDLSQNAPTSWSWDFGDGATSLARNPSHEYVTVGLYTVALTVANSGGANTCAKAELVQALPPPPVAAFSGTPTQGAVPLAVAFTDASSGNPSSWSWTFGDGESATQQHPVHTYSLAGLYTVTLTVSNAGGASSTSSPDYINALPLPPTAAFSADITVGPIPLTVRFADESAGSPTSWSWAFGDGGGSAEPAPSHTYLSPGVFTVTLTVGNAGGATTETKVDYVAATAPPPLADFTLAPASGTAPLRVSFRDASTGAPTAWTWDFGDGAGSVGINPTHRYTRAGVYTVSLTVSNVNGATTKILPGSITVTPPLPVASFTSDVASGEVPLTVRFSDRSTNRPTSWSWDLGDGATATTRNVTHKYLTSGSFTVSLTVANASGSDTLTVAGAIVATLTWEFVGPLPPINPDGSSVFKKKSSVPVRFQLRNSDDKPVPGVEASLFVAPVGADGRVGTYQPAPNDNGSSSNLFYYSNRVYQFDLATGSLSQGPWILRIVIGGSGAKEVRITLIR